ncbi:MAG: hypothetical protein OEY93_05190, partial [Anaerolineae bacterium]|nr:hypothetical protein [Anaerolineae bacterium]
MTNIKKSPKLTLIFRYFVLLLLIFLLSVPLAFTAREECKDSTDLAAVLPESVCTYLIENKPVSASTLLSLTQLFTLIILASNWNLTGGITGYIDFGHSVFFGMGAFATALLMGSSRWEEWPAIISDWNFWPAMIVGALISSFLA